MAARHFQTVEPVVLKIRAITLHNNRWINTVLQIYLCFNSAPHHEGVLGECGIPPRILDFGIRRM